MGQQDVDSFPRQRLPDSGSQFQAQGANAHLALRVLVRARPVADRPTETGDDKAGRLHHSPVEILAAGRPDDRPVRDERAPQRVGPAQVGVMVAGDVQQRLVGPADQVLEVLEGQVATGDDEVWVELSKGVTPERLRYFVSNGEDAR